MRRTLEPIVAAGAVAHLTDADFEALERSISVCEPFVVGHEQALDQRCEDIHFTTCWPRLSERVLRCLCQIINQMLHSLVIVAGNVTQRDYQAFGRTTLAAHRAILEAAGGAMLRQWSA